MYSRVESRVRLDVIVALEPSRGQLGLSSKPGVGERQGTGVSYKSSGKEM